MKSAILTAINQPLVVDDVEYPEPTYGQTRVRLIFSGICGAQLQEIAGHKGNAGYMPHLLGHEGCAIVERPGPGVKSVQPGDKVVLHWRKGDGVESDIPEYRWNCRLIKGGRVTTFNEISVVSENRMTKVPRDTPPELCALLGCGLSTALGTIEHEAKLLMGESVLIIGCGGLGLSLIRAARMRMASRITCSDIGNKGSLPITLGASEVLYGMNWGRGISSFYDVVIDTTGNRDAIALGIRMTAPSGRFIMVGQPGPEVSMEITNARHMFEGTGKTIMATQGGRFSPSQDIARYVRLHESGQLNLDGIVSHRISLDQINDGIELVRNGQAGRVMIVM